MNLVYETRPIAGFEGLYHVTAHGVGEERIEDATLHPRAGNPTQRIDETPAGMLNSIGLQNIGVQKLIRDMAPVWERWTVPVIVSILGSSVEEYGDCAAALDGVPGIAALELNISSPNALKGGMEFGQDPDVAAAVTAACEPTMRPVTASPPRPQKNRWRPWKTLPATV